MTRQNQIDARNVERQAVALERIADALERIAKSAESDEWQWGILDIAEAAARVSPPPPEPDERAETKG